MASGTIKKGMRLLWLNPAPTSGFGAQTLNLPGNDCSFFLVIPVHQTNDVNVFPACIVIPGLGSALMCPQGQTNGYVGAMSQIVRRITASTQTSITFELANVINATGTAYSDRNDLAVPYAIYGF